MAKISETETVIKRIIPYLQRRGYDVDKDFTFEYPTTGTTRANLGFVDVLVKQGGQRAFLIEAKRIAKTLADKDRAQAVEYGRDCKVPFVVLTNGAQFESLNSATGKRIKWNGRLSDKLPSKAELPKALAQLKKDPQCLDVTLKNDTSLPYRPGLALKQLNGLFSRCHNTIRKIERNEDHAFADFAKLLFLKLLEEKADVESITLPYSYRFFELAAKPEAEADQVKTAITSMLEAVKSKTPYGDVINETLYLKNSRTYRKIVVELSQVSLSDSRTDTKGAAFEYFVRATLKGKKLGQYFTPRPLIDLMHAIIGKEKILKVVATSGSMRVVDPACGTGGFLVYLMLAAIEQANNWEEKGDLTIAARDTLIGKLRQQVFYGADAHEGVASSAKMNMIIAGDGHSNVQCEDTLSRASTIWDVDSPDIDLIVTNPPFGTSEGESMDEDDLGQFPLKGAKGQILFLQKMIATVKPGGEICTVIDEGLLNTEQAAELRAHILEHTILKGVIRLPDTTFKPNKINVKSSVLHLVKREQPQPDLDAEYPIFFVDVATLGYHGSGDSIRGFDLQGLINEISAEYYGKGRQELGAEKRGTNWRWFTRSSLDVASDDTKRFDFKYWDPETLTTLNELTAKGAKSVKDLNQLPTKRGKSPKAELYVDEEDGYGLVIKAGSNITKYGTVLVEGDFVEKSVFDDSKAEKVQDGDVLVSSTGDGTLGKAAVFRGTTPAIIDGHVALIRLDQSEAYPEYVCDYLRAGFGAAQIGRLFTGSTGLIELPPDQLDRVLVPLPSLPEQKDLSARLRAAEVAHAKAIEDAGVSLSAAMGEFAS